MCQSDFTGLFLLKLVKFYIFLSKNVLVCKTFFFQSFLVSRKIYLWYPCTVFMESDLRAWQTRGLGDRVKDLVTRKNKGHVSGD